MKIILRTRRTIWTRLLLRIDDLVFKGALTDDDGRRFFFYYVLEEIEDMVKKGQTVEV